MRRIVAVGLLGAAITAAGCEEEAKGGDGITVVIDAAPEVDMEVAEPDAGPVGDASLEDLLVRYCERSTRAKCEWAFACPAAAAGIGTLLDLGGNDVESCVAAVAPRCVDDVTDRDARGTIRFSPEAIERCVESMGRVPCIESSVNEWAGDWHKRVQSNCGSVAAGTVDSGGECERDTDCQDGAEKCFGGSCRLARFADITAECAATGARMGDMNPDAACPGGQCMQVGANENDHPGICTIDCHTGTGCPPGAWCLTLSAGAGRASVFCTQPCEQDRDCAGFECVLVDAQSGNPARHCWAAPPE